MLPAPNYTQSPNVFFDEVFKTLKEGELRVILVLVRQTFGWHKKFDRISLNKIADQTGMEKSSVCKSLASLIAKGLVHKKKFGSAGKERCYYALSMEDIKHEELDDDDGVESEEEREIISNNSYGCSKNTPPGVLKTPPRCSTNTPPGVLKTPTKESPKETVQKKQQQPAAVFSATETKEQRKPEVYPSLVSIDIPHDEKVKITNRFSAEDVDYGLKFLAAYDKPLTKGFAAALKWACQTKPEIFVSKATQEQVNKDYASKHQSVSVPEVRVEALANHVEINRPGTTYCFCLEYKQNGFIDQFTNALRKNGLKVFQQ